MKKHSERDYCVPSKLKTMRVSKLVMLFFCCFVCCSIHAIAYAQNHTITVKKTNSTIITILREIETKSGLTFCFNDNLINVNKTVSVDVKNGTVEKAISEVLRTTGYQYRIVGKQVLITPPHTEGAVIDQQQIKKRVIGMVIDLKGEPIIGASIKEINTTNGVITDMDGRFTIMVLPKATLNVSYIGYTPQEISVGNRSAINIVLTEDAKTLGEVVVIGYGQQKKSSIVSSINTIEATQLNVKSANLTTGIAGKLPGVISVQRSGEPGNDGAAFFIRGQSSYGGGTNPLILVDGIPRSMKDIDVDEIESFTVLKDAAATAVYGAEGANGVVLITSKRGKIQKTQISISAQYNVVTPTRMPELMSAYDYLNMFNEATWNDIGNPDQYTKTVSDEVLEKYRTGADPDLCPNTNWMDLFKSQTQSQRYTISFRGGSDKVRYFASGVYYSEDGIFKSESKDDYNANIGLQRFNLRSNVDMNLTSTTQLSLDMSGQYLRKNNPGESTGDLFFYTTHFPVHLIPMMYSDGTCSDANGGWGLDKQPYNMLNNSGYIKTWGAFLQTKVTLDQKLDFITKGLSVKGIVSFDADFNSSLRRSKTPATFYATDRDENGELIKKVIKSEQQLGDPVKIDNGIYGQKKIYLEASLNYQHIFNEKHDVTGLLLYMQKESQNQNAGGMQLLPYRKQSVVARASYAYDTRYMLEASMGMTGSENFAQGHRWGLFPAVGGAWFISHEKFMKPISKYISTLKLRASYGITGNDDIGGNRFPYRENINTGASGYNLGLSPGAGGNAINSSGGGIVEGAIAMPTLSWEKEKKINLGIDLGLFDGRVYLSADYFSNRREDILVQRRTILDVTGIRVPPYQNLGITTNKGVDGSMTLKQKMGDVTLSGIGNFTFAKSKVLEYDEIPPRYPYQSVTGSPLSQPWLYIAEGLYTPDDFNITTNANGAKDYELKDGYAKPTARVKPGDIRYRDLNGDGVINTYDSTVNNKFYSTMPEIVYGFGLNIEWKGLFVGVFFQGTAHSSINLIQNANTLSAFTVGKDGSSARNILSNRWSAADPYNQNVLFPRMHSGDFDYNRYNSTWWYRDSGFLRFKNAEFGYEFNKKLLKKYKINSLRVYLQGNNLAVWDKVKFWDPELDPSQSGSVYPLCSTYTIGLDITF